jgi:hypothetical protein
VPLVLLSAVPGVSSGPEIELYFMNRSIRKNLPYEKTNFKVKDSTIKLKKNQ